MLQQDRPDDYVIATGETHSVREFAEKVFAKLGLDYQKHVAIDPRYFRPTEVDVLLGDATKARKALGWQPKVELRGAHRHDGRRGSGDRREGEDPRRRRLRLRQPPDGD